MYRIRNTQKQTILLQQNKRILKTSDLAVLWGVENKNTLYTTIKRFTQKEILFSIQKGMYATIPIVKLDKYELGCAISGSLSYVSAETVLQNSGVIMQNVSKITLFGEKTEEIRFNDVVYFCKKMDPKFLINRKGIEDKAHYSVATLERAVADILFINPKYYFDNKTPINIEKVDDINISLGYKTEK